MSWSPWAGAALVALAACSPYGGGAYTCSDSAQCSTTGVAGVCEPTGFCSFADGSCSTGRRYGDSSGSLSNTCVGDIPPMIDAPTSDIDAPDGYVPDARTCFGDALTVCLTTLPTMPRTLPATIDTANDCDEVVTQPSGPELCVVAATTMTVTGTRATGARPLVLVATESLTVSGTLDVSSVRGQTPGAGADSNLCTTAQAGVNDGGGASGGAGGSFAGKGGDGGDGDQNGTKSNGGNAGAAQTTTVVRGGCKGGKGGNGAGAGGAGGSGGGAVYLIAATQIEVTASGAVYASGAGGGGGGTEGGGGGGGSGGLIGLDAPTLTISGKVAANGAGGGGGGSNTGGNGAPGGDGTTSSYDQRASGGTGTGTNRGDGGRGTSLATIAGENGGNADGGAGGGGGGIGLVWVHGTLTGTQISPAPTTH